MKFIFIALFLSLTLYAECKLDNKILYSVLMTEAHPNKKLAPLGYEYLISFNNKKEARRVRKVYPSYFLDSRTMDCKNKNTCIAILSNLKRHGIVNLDLGAFQINMREHKRKDTLYFDLSDSYGFACDYISKFIDERGYNWYAIACYHSKTPKYNIKYQKRLIKNYKYLSKSL